MSRIVSVRVVANVAVSWVILAMAMQIESENMRPELEKITETMRTLGEEIPYLIQEIEKMRKKIHLLLEETENLKAESLPVWADEYNLCGDPECYGDCRICQEGEYDGEEYYTEKYCHRGKR